MAKTHENEVIYEVNLCIEKPIFEENKSWLIEHMHDMVRENNFLKVHIFYEENFNLVNDDLMRYVKITAQYHVNSLANLTTYLEKNAKKMRSQVVDRFQSHYSVSRRVLTLDSIFEFEIIKEES